MVFSLALPTLPASNTDDRKAYQTFLVRQRLRSHADIQRLRLHPERAARHSNARIRTQSQGDGEVELRPAGRGTSLPAAARSDVSRPAAPGAPARSWQ